MAGKGLLQRVDVGGRFERTAASVMGKRMFDAGEHAWPEEAPFHTPAFVATPEKRDPWERPGGTTLHFVNDGIERALDHAREAAGGEPCCGHRGDRGSARQPSHGREPVPVAPDTHDRKPDTRAARRRPPYRTGLDRRNV